MSAGALQGLAFAAAIGAIAYGAFSKPPPPTSNSAEVFDRVWRLIDENYWDADIGGVDWDASRERFRPIAIAADDTAELYENAIWPMLDQIGESHVDAVRPTEDTSRLADKIGHFSGRRGEVLSGASEGVGDLGGLDIVFDGQRWFIYDVRQGSEADRADLSPGLVIAGLGVDAASEGRIRAQLRVADASGETRQVSYEFEPQARSSEGKLQIRNSGVVVMRFNGFDRETVDWALGQLKSAEPKPLVIDLRGNRGGDIDETLRFIAAFVPGKVSIGNSLGRGWPHTFPMEAPSDGMEYRGPIAVLIGPKTSSGGEVTSYALGKHRNAPLVGERTAGAVLAAKTFYLPDGGELMIATGNFITADNQRLEGDGVSPTMPVAPTLAAIREGRDLALEAAERAVLAVAP